MNIFYLSDFALPYDSVMTHFEFSKKKIEKNSGFFLVFFSTVFISAPVDKHKHIENEHHFSWISQKIQNFEEILSANMSHFFTQARFWTSRWPNQTCPCHPKICYGSYDWWNWNMNILYLSDFDLPWDPYVTHFTNDSFFQKNCFKPYLRLAVTPANLSRSTQALLWSYDW